MIKHNTPLPTSSQFPVKPACSISHAIETDFETDCETDIIASTTLVDYRIETFEEDVARMTLQETKDEHERKRLDKYVLYKELDILEAGLRTCSKVDDVLTWWILSGLSIAMISYLPPSYSFSMGCFCPDYIWLYYGSLLALVVIHFSSYPKGVGRPSNQI